MIRRTAFRSFSSLSPLSLSPLSLSLSSSFFVSSSQHYGTATTTDRGSHRDGTKSAAFYRLHDSALKRRPPPIEYEASRNERIDVVQRALAAKGFGCVVCATASEALEELKAAIPRGATVHQSSSTTLKQIGYIDYAKGSSLPFVNYGAQILAEQDVERQAELRRRCNDCDVFLTSCSALTEEGDLIFVDATGTRTGPIPHAAKKVIVVTGSNKIVPTYEEAVRRTEEYSVPLESARCRDAYNIPGATLSYFLAVKSSVYHQGRITVLLIKEELGF